jgi:hypothetical protein
MRSARVHEGDLGGLRALRASQRVKHALVVSLEKEPRKLAGGLEVLPWRAFVQRLWRDELVQ